MSLLFSWFNRNILNQYGKFNGGDLAVAFVYKFNNPLACGFVVVWWQQTFKGRLGITLSGHPYTHIAPFAPQHEVLDTLTTQHKAWWCEGFNLGWQR